jgi:hypothetical protein
MVPMAVTSPPAKKWCCPLRANMEKLQLVLFPAITFSLFVGAIVVLWVITKLLPLAMAWFNGVMN